ncbi:MAG: DUF4197 domain-containing protein, partial [Ferruginibacter sp.]|nr:DUF4197 domain-containing protein [Ferruginibacter sp.]
MKTLFTLIIAAVTLGSCETIQQVANAAGAGTGIGISNTEAAAGIKEALGQGIVKSVLQLNTT